MSEEQIPSGAAGEAAGAHDSVENQDIGEKIVTGGIARLIAYGVATGMGVLSVAVISREVGPANFALFTTTISLIAISTVISDIGLVSLGVREFAALEGAERVRSQRALITLRFLFAVFACVAIVVYAWLRGYPSGLMTGLLAAAIGLCGLSLHASYNVPLQATFRLNTIAWLEVSRQAMVALGMTILALVTGEIGWVVAIYLPVGISMAFASAFLARKITPIAPSLDWGAMGGLLRHVGTFAVAASVGAIYAYVAQVISDSILPAHESGMFGLAFRVFAVLIGACMTAVSGAFPLLVTASRTDPDRLAYATRRLIQTAALAGAACSVGLMTGASFVVAVIGGPQYVDAVPIVAVIGLALPASFMLFTGSNVLLASGRHRELVLVSVVGATASVAITAALASAFSTAGAAWGIVVGETLIASAYLVQMARLDRRVLPGPNWAAGVLVAAAIACAPALLPWPGIVRAAFGLSIFIALAFGMKLLPPELLDRVRSLSGRKG